MIPATIKPMSADDHVIEPPHLWVDRVPSAYQDRCPQFIETDGRHAWLYEDELTPLLAGSCILNEEHSQADFPPGSWDLRFEDIRPGCYDPVERIKDMDVDGVWGQLCFPNYARFGGHRFFLNVKDLDLGDVCLRTYNDYLLDEWCGTDPDRLFGVVVLPLYDVDKAVAELERVIPKGARAIAFSENPTVLGLPSVHSGHWDPIWAAASEAGLPICMHIGSSSRLINTSDDAPATVMVTLNGINALLAGTDWLLSGILERFPGLSVMLSEGGAGWIPYLLERADKTFFDARLQQFGRSRGNRPPSELFAEHMYVCLVDEHFALRSLADIPIDNLLWEGDYPHGDGLWPNNRKYLEEAFADVPEADSQQILEDNLRKVLKV